MTYGYTLMSEQSGPRELVAHAAAAEHAGFDFEVVSDHFFPWLDALGHSPYAWSVLGAVTQVTERVELMTYVTCPTMRYHPAVVAQKAATVDLLSNGRFTLGLGAGENLNEHVVGAGWPPANVRHEMLAEALTIITSLFGRVRRLHRRPLPRGLRQAVGRPSEPGADRGRRLGRAVRAGVRAPRRPPDRRRAPGRAGELWDEVAGEAPGRKIGQLPVCWGDDRDACLDRAHDLFRWFGGGWKVNAELPGTAAFASASQFVTKDDVADSIPCGPDLDPIVSAVREFEDAGFTDIALVQIGDESQADFLAIAEKELLPALRG